jgi:hypothetical protein
MRQLCILLYITLHFSNSFITQSISLPDSCDAKQRTKYWENLKTWAKKVLAKEKRPAKLTGGGISISLPADGQSSAIVSIIPAQITTRFSGILS